MRLNPLVRLNFLRQVCGASLVTLLLNQPVSAASINGTLEYSYNHYEVSEMDKVTKTRDISKTESFAQRYHLNLKQELLPLVRLSAGTLLDLNDSRTRIEDESIHGYSRMLNSFVNVAFTNQHLGGSFGYSKRSENPGKSNVEIYNGSVRFKPDELPDLTVSGSQLHNYDSDHQLIDTVSNSLTVSSVYVPNQNVTVNYNGGMGHTDVKLADVTSSTMSQSMRFNYTNNFLQHRMIVTTDYNIYYQESRLKAGLGGQLPPQPLVIGIEWRQELNVTLPPTVSYSSLPILASTSNLAISLLNPGGVPQISVGRVLVADLNESSERPNIVRLVVSDGFDKLERNFPDKYAELVSIMNSRIITWYGSDDGVSWTAISPMMQGGLQHSDEASDQYYYVAYNVSNFKQRYLMATFSVDTTFSLPAGYSAADFKIQEERFFTSVPETVRTLNTNRLNGVLNLGVRVQLTKSPAVTYDFNLQLSHLKSKGTDQLFNYLVMNGLGYNQRLSNTLFLSARIIREDAESSHISHSRNTWGASLNFRPLPTLEHTFSYSGHYAENDGKSGYANSLSVSNVAQIYQGFSLSFLVGVSQGSSEQRVESSSFTMQAGGSIVPHPRVSLSFGGSQNVQHATGGGKPAQDTLSRQATFSVNYRPLDNLYAFYQIAFGENSNSSPQTTNSFGGSWTPFRDGKVQLALNYSESSSSGGNKDRYFTQNIHWDIRSNMALDLGRTQTRSASDAQVAVGTNYYATVRFNF